MSKAAAIHMAILTQMAVENKEPPDLRRALCSRPANGAQGEIPGPYNSGSIRAFLSDVAWRLRGDTPPFEFKWSEFNFDKCPGESLRFVEAEIAALTSELAPPEPKGAAKPKDSA